MNFKVIVLLVLCIGCKSYTVDQQKKADRIVKSKIKHLEQFYELEEGYSEELIEASHFMEKLTKLKSDYAYDYSKVAPQNNSDLIKWKTWYKTNKHLLYWDKQSQSVLVKQ